MFRFIFCAVVLSGFASARAQRKLKPVLMANNIIVRLSAILKAAVLAMKMAIQLWKHFSLQIQINGVLLPFSMPEVMFLITGNGQPMPVLDYEVYGKIEFTG